MDPISHTLEATILKGVHHEEVSLKIFQQLNKEFDGRLSKAIEIFKGTYQKPFFTSIDFWSIRYRSNGLSQS
jgi:hypothetical protein